MKTYRAELAPWRTKPLHPLFVAKAKEHQKKLCSPRYGRGHAHETTCPYCGAEDKLAGIIRIGAKEHATEVPMTRHGWRIEGVKDREQDILLIRCKNPACKAAIDPLAYLSPATFYADHTNAPVLSEDAPVY